MEIRDPLTIDWLKIRNSCGKALTTVSTFPGNYYISDADKKHILKKCAQEIIDLIKEA